MMPCVDGNRVQDVEITANNTLITLYVLSTIILGAQHLADAVPPELDANEQAEWMLDRLFAVITELKARVDHVDQGIRDMLAMLTTPQQPTGEAQDDDTAEIAKAVEAASMHLWCAGAVPLILVFSEDERKELGDTPFAHLSELLAAAASGDAQALEKAQELTRKLSAGAQMRSWDKPGELQIAEEIVGEQAAGAGNGHA
jgi:hypothetical protein